MIEELELIVTEARAADLDVLPRNGHVQVAGEKIDSLADWDWLRIDLGLGPARRPCAAAALDEAGVARAIELYQAGRCGMSASPRSSTKERA